MQKNFQRLETLRGLEFIINQPIQNIPTLESRNLCIKFLWWSALSFSSLKLLNSRPRCKRYFCSDQLLKELCSDYSTICIQTAKMLGFSWRCDSIKKVNQVDVDTNFFQMLSFKILDCFHFSNSFHYKYSLNFIARDRWFISRWN